MAHMDINNYAIAPTGDQLASFNAEMSKYGGMQPLGLVDGDSRANLEGSNWLPGGGAPVNIDLGISGDTIENWDWVLENSTIDMSHAVYAFDEIGVNSERFVPGETEQNMLKATMAGIKYQLAHMAPGAVVYFDECYNELNDAYGVGALNAAYNHDMAVKCAASGGSIVFVAVNYLLTADDYRDPTHLNDAGEAIVHAANLSAAGLVT